MSDHAVSLQNISRVFSSRYILKNINAQFKEGERVAILGPNGAGKTTLLKIISTLLAPTSGELQFWNLTPEVYKARIRPQIGVVFSEGHFYTDLTVLENLDLICRLRNIPDGKKKCAKSLDRWNLSNLSTATVRTLSRGERQRLALLRSLLHEPRLLIWDEPTTGLDERSRQVLNEIALEQKRETTILCTTHELSYIKPWVDRTLMLENGALA